MNNLNNNRSSNSNKFKKILMKNKKIKINIKPKVKNIYKLEMKIGKQLLNITE